MPGQPRSVAGRFVIVIACAAAFAACGSQAAVSSTRPTSPTPAAAAPTVSASVSATASVAPATALPSPSAIGEPAFDPANFPDGATIDNEWFPLLPGTSFTSRGTKDDEPAVDVFTVTTRTRVIAGVTTRVVEDRLTLSGVLEERTSDYYAQDKDGNVWYLGEDTAELDKHGKVVSREGTWHAGADGAVPGIYMNATPAVGDQFRQEFYKGHAEDHFQVVNVDASIKVPYGSFKAVLQTKEWTPLEPDVLDNKFYVRGLGQVREVAVKGPVEELVLVSVKRP
jgi:hypothetical protein